MVVIPDGKILTEMQFEVSAPCGEHTAAVDGGGPDDFAVQDALDVLDDGVAFIAAATERRVGVRAEQNGVRAVYAGQTQLFERVGNGDRVVADIGRQRQRLIGGAFANADDAGGLVAVENGPVFGAGKFLGGIFYRLPVGIIGAALHIVDCVAPQLEWHGRSEEHTSELQSLMRISYAVFCLKKKKKKS